MKFSLPILAVLISLYSILFSFSCTKKGREYEVYNYELVLKEYKTLQRLGADKSSLEHVFKRRQRIGGIKSLFISWLNIDGYKKYHYLDSFSAFEEYAKKNDSRIN